MAKKKIKHTEKKKQYRLYCHKCRAIKIDDTPIEYKCECNSNCFTYTDNRNLTSKYIVI